MPGPIVLSSSEAASNSDILQGTRLQTVPSGGFLTFEFQADAADGGNNHEVSIQMPNGDTPFNGVRIPKGATALGLNANDKTMITLPIQQGGHTVLSTQETGTANLFWRVTYTPA